MLLLALASRPSASPVSSISTATSASRANGELTVTERITLEVDDRQPHSVLRRELRAPIVVADVIRNGHPEPWLLEPDGDGARLRIGKPGAALPHGRHTYQIAYRSQRQVRFLDAPRRAALAPRSRRAHHRRDRPALQRAARARSGPTRARTRKASCATAAPPSAPCARSRRTRK